MLLHNVLTHLASKHTACERHAVRRPPLHLQYLQGGDLVLQELLGLVEVRQHVLGLPVVEGVHLDQVPLVLLGHLLLVDPGGDARGGTHSTQETVRLLREQ